MADEEEATLKGILMRIQGWEAELKKLQQQMSEIQKRKNEAYTQMWSMIHD